jgi:pyruvate formate lyase activating enzyme
MKGLVFSVKRYSIHDGPGIRVTFFMKGCPLSCWWCHNPEGISGEPEEIAMVHRVGEMEFTRKETAGEYYEVGDILSILEKERIFIESSNGGVTFSGGEPMMQFEFLLEALKACREAGYHTAVDTSGYFPSARLESILPYTSLFLFDLKHLDPGRHMEYTGVPNSVIINNLNMIIRSGAEVMLRIPVIPGINDDAEHLSVLKEFINNLEPGSVRLINLLPFHKTGSAKYLKLKREYRLESVKQPTTTSMNELKEYFSDTGIKIKIGG